MDAKTVIEAYVQDVTGHLPGRERSDVALELRALLTEELAGRAASAGRPADEAMAMELLVGFGPPAQVAQRYRPQPPLIDAADTRGFLIVAVIGGVLLAMIAPLSQPHPPKDIATTAVLTWLGLLLVIFAFRAWTKRRWPKLAAWKPRDRDRVNRPATAALVAVILLGLACYGAPNQIFAALIPGAHLPATLLYDPRFAATRLPLLLVIWAATAGLYAWTAISGRWRQLAHRADAGLELAVALVLVWFAAAGPIMQAPTSDHVLKAWLAPIVVGLLADVFVKFTRLSRPSSLTPPAATGAVA